MLSKTTRDAVKWALKSLGEIEEKETESKPSGFPEEFEWLWKNYPERSGGKGNKKTAYQYCNALIKKGETWKTLAQYMKAYEEHCKKEGKVGTSFVLQFTSFFSSGERYKENWNVTAKPKQEQQSGFSAMVERANSGELYESNQAYFFRDGKKWNCATDYYKNLPPLEE